CDNALLTGFATNKKSITAEIISEVTESLDLLRPMIASTITDDPQALMVESLPPMPVLRESDAGNWIADAKPQRRRRSRRQDREPADGRQGTLLQSEKSKAEVSQFSPQFKLLPPIENQAENHEADIQENVKAS